MWLPGKVIAKANTPRSCYGKNNMGKIIKRNSIYLKSNKNIFIGSSGEENKRVLVKEVSTRPIRLKQLPNTFKEFVM